MQEHLNQLLRAVCPRCKSIVRVSEDGFVFTHSIPVDQMYKDLLGWRAIPDCDGVGELPYLNHVKEMQLIDMRRVPIAHYWTVNQKTLEPKEIVPCSQPN